MDVISHIAKFFRDGGQFMAPIALVAVIGIAIATERYLYLTWARSKNQSLWKQIEPLLGAGNFRGAAEAASKSASAIGQILTYGLARIQGAKRRDDVEKAMEESLMGIVPRLEKRTHYLATFANLATLLGLLGHRDGPDPGLQRGGQGQSGREGEPAVGLHLRGDELYRLRPDDRGAAAGSSTRCCRPRPRS